MKEGIKMGSYYEIRVSSSSAWSLDDLPTVSRHSTIQEALDYVAKANAGLDDGSWYPWCIVEIDEDGMVHAAEYTVSEDGIVHPIPYMMWGLNELAADEDEDIRMAARDIPNTPVDTGRVSISGMAEAN